MLKKEPLFTDKIEAWIHGLAIASLYREYKRFGFDPISIEVKDSEIDDVPSKDLLDEVWSAYGKYDAKYLEFLTHNEDPWLKARDAVASDEHCENEITQESMQSYYSHRLQSST